MAGLFGGGGSPPPVEKAPPIPDRSDAEIQAMATSQRKRYATILAGRGASIFASGNPQADQQAVAATSFLGGSRA